MDASILIGLLGSIFGMLLGVIIGAKTYSKGALDAVNEKLTFERDRNVKEKKEREEYALNMIMSFLKNEIEINYNVIGISTSKKIYILKNERLHFEEYERIKYKLLEHPTDMVKEINKLYRLFYDLLLLSPSNQDPERINKLEDIVKQKDLLDAYFN